MAYLRPIKGHRGPRLFAFRNGSRRRTEAGPLRIIYNPKPAGGYIVKNILPLLLHRLPVRRHDCQNGCSTPVADGVYPGRQPAGHCKSEGEYSSGKLCIEDHNNLSPQIEAREVIPTALRIADAHPGEDHVAHI